MLQRSKMHVSRGAFPLCLAIFLLEHTLVMYITPKLQDSRVVFITRSHLGGERFTDGRVSHYPFLRKFLQHREYPLELERFSHGHDDQFQGTTVHLIHLSSYRSALLLSSPPSRVAYHSQTFHCANTAEATRSPPPPDRTPQKSYWITTYHRRPPRRSW